MASVSILICKECEYSNEPQRIFCHQCGAKLDRAAIIEHAENEETDAEKQKRVRNLLNPGASAGAVIRRWIGTAVNGIFLGAIAAVLIQMLRPPLSVPADTELSANAGAPLQLLERMTASSARQTQFFPTAVINQYLKSQVRIKPPVGFIKFERVFVTTTKGELSLTLQTAIQGYSLYTGMTYQLVAGGKQGEATPVGFSVGRLQFPSFVAPWVDRYVSLSGNFKSETDVLSKMESLSVSPEGVTVVTTPRPFVPSNTLSKPSGTQNPASNSRP